MAPHIAYRFRLFTPQDAAGLFNALGDKRVIRHMASEGITLDVCHTIITEAIQHWEIYHIESYAVVDQQI